MQRNILWIAALVAACLLWTAAPIDAMVLDDESRIDVVLGDGTSVVLYAEAGRNGRRAPRWYYLPTGLRLAARPDGAPEFLFLKYTTEDGALPGGGLLHFLVEWGLTAEQEREVERLLQDREPEAHLAGAAPLEPVDEAGAFRVVSATLGDDGLTPVVATSGAAPLVPGGRAAVASRLTAEGAQLLAASFESARSIADVSLALDFSYTTLQPAARGRIRVDWSRLETESETLTAEYTKTPAGRRQSTKCLFIFCSFKDEPEYAYTYEEAREQLRFLEENEIVTLEFDELVADERVTRIREAFFRYFLDSMAKPDVAAPPPPPAEEEQDASPDVRFGRSYKFSRTAFESAFERKVQTFDLTYRLASRWPFQLVGNLAAWYDAVRDDPRHVAAVNLNDPFFEHRDVRFLLDLEAREIFDEAINYVTVQVRKRRASGRDFEDRVTLDKRWIDEHGMLASVTYARGEDDDPDAFEYRVQWSFPGGRLHPAAPEWQPGSWEAVTLSPPLAARTVEVEADLAELEAADVTRAIVEVRYPRLGQEEVELIRLSTAKGEPLVSQRLFLDRDARGFVYRVILHHKRDGRLALPWSPRVGDDYVYVTVPPELLEEDSPEREIAKEEGRTANRTPDNVLQQFEDVLGGLSK